MIKAQIAKTISSRLVDTMKVVVVKCRPSEKSNKVLVTRVGGHDWYCERPTYFWSTFDRSFIEPGFLAEQQLLYPKILESLGFFDTRGLWWGREEMSSFGLVRYFLRNPIQYLWAMRLHTKDVSEITLILQKIHRQLVKPHLFVQHLRTFQKLFTRLYRFQATVYITFDELAWQFRELLLKHLPKEMVNTYFPRFLAGEATREALRKGYSKERGAVEYQTTRGVLYGANLEPHAFYVPPKLFHAYPEDQEILGTLIVRHIPRKALEEFLAFRVMVPVGFQINEEAQYIETTGLSAHLGVLMRAIAKHTKKAIEEFQTMAVDSIIRLLKK